MTYELIPPAFRPVIRIVSVSSGVSRDEYVARLINALAPNLDDVSKEAFAQDICNISFPVYDPDVLLASWGINRDDFPEEVAIDLDAEDLEEDTDSVDSLSKKVVQAYARGDEADSGADLYEQLEEARRYDKFRALRTQALRTVRRAFKVVPDVLLDSELTAVSGQDAAFADGTLVWVREGMDATLQFLFPRIQLDLTGEEYYRDVKMYFEPLESSSPAVTSAENIAVIATVDAVQQDTKASGKQWVEWGAEWVSSWSWALPPPWGAVVTGGLSFLQIVLRVTDKPDKDGFLENLQAALVKAMEIHDVKEYMEDVEKFSSDLIYEASKIYTGNSMPVDGYPGFETWFFNDSTGIYHLDNKVNHLVSTLEGKTSVTEGQDLLTFSCTASTVFATGWKVWMQYNAYKLQAQHARGDDSGFASGSAKWQEAFGNIGWYLFGISNPYYAPTTTTSKKGYGNRIDTWIQTTRKARIDQIKPPERVKKTVASYTMKPGPGYKSAVTYKEIPGWRFVDEADNDVWKHFRKDTEEKVDTCHTKTVEHADEVRTEYNNWVAEVTKQLDAVSAKVTQTITALKASIDEMSSQMPPLPPTTLPIVTLHTTGTATPKGLWTNGATVSYQIAFANDHVNGNDHQYGNFGPATTPLTIGDFAGAKLTNLPQHSNKNFYIYILRTINTPGSKPVVRMLVPVKMGTLEFDDVA